ncbi:hypothetical protein FB451DRAFT_1300626 [Mycena latifolia]|nr:hypothetical protein FB451DRAFT_1300626 [Mycena latifolia]
MPPFAYYAAVPSPTQSYPLDVALHCVLSTLAHRLAPGLLFACMDSYPTAPSSASEEAFTVCLPSGSDHPPSALLAAARALQAVASRARADGATQAHIDDALCHLRGRLPSQYRARMGPNRPEVMTGGHGRQNVRTAPVPVDAPDAQGADEDVTMVDAGEDNEVTMVDSAEESDPNTRKRVHVHGGDSGPPTKKIKTAKKTKRKS